MKTKIDLKKKFIVQQWTNEFFYSVETNLYCLLTNDLTDPIQQFFKSFYLKAGSIKHWVGLNTNIDRPNRKHYCD